MAYDAAQRKNLGDKIRRRREQLELSLRDAADKVDMSITTWINAEHGKTSPSGITLGKFEKALGWPEDTCRAILAAKPVTSGGQEKPKPDDTTGLAIGPQDVEPLVRACMLAIEPLVRDYMRAAVAKAVYFDGDHGSDS